LDPRSLRARGIVFVSTSELLIAGLCNLSPTDHANLAGASPLRVREFATGRLCAKQALRHLGIEPDTIGTGPHREPIWPAGVVGSISHTSGFCCAAVSTAWQGLGVDTQRLGNILTLDQARRICSYDERRRLSALSSDEQQLALHIIFSAKESSFKAVFPLIRRFFGFADISLEIDWVHGGYRVDMSNRLRCWLPYPVRCQGEFWVDEELVTSLVTVRRE
jgi:4'-phosphopantetheinyl transferase EntD